MRDSGEEGSVARDTSFKQSRRDDKLGRIHPLRLDFLASHDAKDFERVPLQNVKSGTLSFSVTWSPASDGEDQVRPPPLAASAASAAARGGGCARR